jgi:hypothetical protein
MEELAQELKCSGIDLAWWPLFLGSYQNDELGSTTTHPAEKDCLDFEETLP